MSNLTPFTRSDPFADFRNVFLDDFFTAPAISRRFTRKTTRVQAFEDRTEITIAAPGIHRENFNVDLTNTTLTVSFEPNEETDSYFTTDNFSQAWTVSHGTTAEDVTATYRNGVLTVNIQKTPATSVSTTITVS